MLAFILKILSILGIILLILLGITLLAILLVLFMPIIYKADAAKSDTVLKANVRFQWMFGFLRVTYKYPEPGNVIVKVLWKTVYDSGKPSTKKGTMENTSENKESTPKNEEIKAESLSDVKVDTQTETNAADGVPPEAEETSAEEHEIEQEEAKTLSEKLFAKYEKIKYTIQQFCDKIKHIWDNIAFYKKLLQDEQTKLLISHALKRIGKILRHIRPGKLKADVIFGTGSPDTTGYAYGVYSMFSPQLGKDVFVTPDFEHKIFTGTVFATGHINILTLLVNALAVLLDKRLRLLIRRLKNHSAKPEKEKA